MIGLAIMLADATARAKRLLRLRISADRQDLYWSRHQSRAFRGVMRQTGSGHGIDLPMLFELGSEFTDATITELTNDVDAKLQGVWR